MDLNFKLQSFLLTLVPENIITTPILPSLTIKTNVIVVNI